MGEHGEKTIQHYALGTELVGAIETGPISDSVCCTLCRERLA